MTLLTTAATNIYAGNPNGNVAGQLQDLCFDSVQGIEYICAAAGNAGAAIWVTPIPYVNYSSSVYVGPTAGNTISTSMANTGVGSGALHAVTTGNANTALGNGTLNLATTANSNCAIGNAALRLITTTGSGDNNTACGNISGFNYASYLNCSFFGFGADATVSGLTNSGSFGWTAQVSVNNAINLGNACYIGLNNPSPAYSLDIAPISGIGAIALPVSTTPATSGSKGTVWMNGSNQLFFTDTTGTSNLISPSSSPFAINPILTQYFRLSGNITLSNSDGQYLYIGNISSGSSLLMPPTNVSGPLLSGSWYTITMAPNDGTNQFLPITLLNYLGTTIKDQTATPIIMYPGDTWVIWYRPTLTNCQGFLLNRSVSPISNFTANYTATYSDFGKTLIFTSDAAVTLTLPPSATLFDGFALKAISVSTGGTGTLTTVPNSGDTFKSQSGSNVVTPGSGTNAATQNFILQGTVWYYGF